MRALILILTAAASLAQPSLAKAEPISSALPDCHDSDITAPAPQTQISIQDAYPPMSVVLGEEGNTTVSFTVKSNGTVDDVQAEESSGSLRLDAAAVNAMRLQLYSPPKRGDQAIDCRGHMRILWRLTDSAGPFLAKQTDVLILSPPKSLYPAKALAEHREGAAAVNVTVGGDGRLVDVRIAQSSGYADLDAASLAYAKTLSASPAKINGQSDLSAVVVIVAWSAYPAQTKKAPGVDSKSK